MSKSSCDNSGISFLAEGQFNANNCHNEFYNSKKCRRQFISAIIRCINHKEQTQIEKYPLKNHISLSLMKLARDFYVY